jgi:translation initiation factor IF-2
MRLYEFAKKEKISSKDLISLLEKEGFVVKNHMVQLGENELAFLKKHFSSQGVLLSAQEQSQKSKSISNKKNSNLVDPNKKKQVKKNIEEEVPQGIAFEPIRLDILAKRINISPIDLIIHLLKSGTVVTINQVIDVDILKQLSSDFSFELIKPITTSLKSIDKDSSDGITMTERLPVVVVLGHVDHGKTSLLDYIRKSSVAAKEKGGITQHLGAYEVKTNAGDFILIDTPGHEAFPKIRKRGAQVADLAILIVAADDGVMPQTVESIKLIQETGISIVVAINKIDKVDSSRIDVVKQQLSQYGILVEDWGGDVVCAPISAKTGQGVDNLLDMVVLQSQLLELKTLSQGSGRGHVIEANLEKGRGAVGTIILRYGSIKTGDYFICGPVAGRVTTMVNSDGEKLDSVGPSVPVQVAGFNELPTSGSYFEVVTQVEYKKFLSSALKKSRIHTFQSQSLVDTQGYYVILKVDTHSSQEALIDAMEKLAKKMEIRLSIVYAGVGNVTEGDVDLAYNTGAYILALHTKVSPRANTLAKKRNIDINRFDIIYKLLEFWEKETKRTETKEAVMNLIGTAKILRVFNIKGIGTIAGCIVESGHFVSNGVISVERGDKEIGRAKIRSLQKEKQSVAEVNAGFECGILAENLNNFKPNDIVKCFIEKR